jgi:hypothetical protein
VAEHDKIESPLLEKLLRFVWFRRDNLRIGPAKYGSSGKKQSIIL